MFLSRNLEVGRLRIIGAEHFLRGFRISVTSSRRRAFHEQLLFVVRPGDRITGAAMGVVHRLVSSPRRALSGSIPRAAIGRQGSESDGAHGVMKSSRGARRRPVRRSMVPFVALSSINRRRVGRRETVRQDLLATSSSAFNREELWRGRSPLQILFASSRSRLLPSSTGRREPWRVSPRRARHGVAHRFERFSGHHARVTAIANRAAGGVALPTRPVLLSIQSFHSATYRSSPTWSLSKRSARSADQDALA